MKSVTTSTIYVHLIHNTCLYVYMIGPCSVVFLSLDLVIYPEIPNTGFKIVT